MKLRSSLIILYKERHGTTQEVLKKLDSAYEVFLNKSTSGYDKIFEKFVIVVKSKTLKTTSTKKGILKSSKTKQRLYYKCFKSKTYEREISCKNYSKLFESIKQSTKAILLKDDTSLQR